MNERRPSDILERYSKVAVIGAGVIGASWTAVFLAHGLTVVVNDPRDDVEAVVNDYIRKASPTLKALGLPTQDLTRKLRFEADLDRAVAGADLRSGERSGTGGIQARLMGPHRAARSRHTRCCSRPVRQRPLPNNPLKMKNPGRLLIGHPFNPPHLIPLVEIVPGEQTEPSAVADAVAFYKAIGKVPRVLRKEIQGFVANRLQRAIFRECCHLVLEGVVTVDELDDIVTSSIGLRWAADGPFRSFHLGGGPGGFVSFFRQFAPGMEAAWKSQAAVTLDEKSQKTIIDQAQASFAATPPEQLEGERDAKQLAILKALAAVKAAE